MIHARNTTSGFGRLGKAMGTAMLLIVLAVAPLCAQELTFDIEDLFPLSEGSSWHYIGQMGSDLEDNFRWDRELALKDVGSGVMAVGLKTTTDEGTDSREDDVDFWYLDAQGVMWFYGFHNGVADGGGAFPVQDVILDPPVKLGERNMMIGSTFSSTGDGTGTADIFGSTIPVNVSLTLVVTYAERIPVFQTGLGPLTDVIRVEVSISGAASHALGSIPIDVFGGEFFLKEDIGMVAQAQTSDSSDAQRQVIDFASVGGMELTPPATQNFFIMLDTTQAGVTGSQATGTADIMIDTTSNTLTYDITSKNLSSSETAAHIHGPALPGVDGPVMHTLPAGSPKMGTWNYPESEEAHILAGLTYINIHTTDNPAGEIRGQINSGMGTTKTLDMGPPVLKSAMDAGQGLAHLEWMNSNETPNNFLGLVYDIYTKSYVQSPSGVGRWFSFDSSATSDDLNLMKSGGYFTWIANQYADGGVFFSDPLPLVLLSGTPHTPMNVAATDAGSQAVNLTWDPDIFGSWLYWIIVYNFDTKQYVTVTGPLGSSVWHYLVWGSSDFNSGSTQLTVSAPGNYFVFLAGFGWDGETFSPYASDYVFVAR